MSHVDEMKLEMWDEEALKTAALARGLEIREKQTYNWWGTHVGDHPLPEGMTKEDLGKCHFVLGVPGQPSAYEVGVVRDNGRLRLLWDYYGDERENSPSHEMVRLIGGRDGSGLKMEYTAQVQEKEAIRNGYRVTRGTNEAGEIVLRMRS